MSINRILVTVAAIVVVASGTVVAVAYAAISDPSRDYVDQNGVVNYELLPDEMQIVGPDGKLIVDEDGKPVTVDSRKLLGPGGPVSPSIDTGRSGDAGSAVPLDLDELIEAYGN